MMMTMMREIETSTFAHSDWKIKEQDTSVSRSETVGSVTRRTTAVIDKTFSSGVTRHSQGTYVYAYVRNFHRHDR